MISFLIGLFVGDAVGILTTALLAANGRCKDNE